MFKNFLIILVLLLSFSFSAVDWYTYHDPVFNLSVEFPIKPNSFRGKITNGPGKYSGTRNNLFIVADNISYFCKINKYDESILTEIDPQKRDTQIDQYINACNPGGQEVVSKNVFTYQNCIAVDCLSHHKMDKTLFTYNRFIFRDRMVIQMMLGYSKENSNSEVINRFLNSLRFDY
jgi:hypothetical protein